MKLENILGFALGPIAAAAFGLITLPVIAWIFDAEDIGRLNILQVTISFVLLLSMLGLDQAYGREFHETANRAALLKACFLPGFALLIIIGLGTAPFATEISTHLFALPDPMLYWLTLAAIISSYFARFLSIILRMEERGLAFSMSQVLPKALLLILIGVMALSEFRKEFMQLQAAFLVSTLAVLFVYSWNTKRQWFSALTAPINMPMLRPLMAYGAPLILAGLAYWGLAATSILVLRSLSSLTELGIYSISMSFAGVASIFQAVFSVVWAPTVYKWAAKGLDLSRIDDVARRALAVVCGIFFACGLFSWLIDYALPAPYKDVKFLVLCSIAQPLLYTLSEVTCVGINITRRTSWLLWSTLAALIVNLGLSVTLVPKWGATGAVVANAIAYIVFFVARTEASAFVWRAFPRRRIYMALLIVNLLSIATVIYGPLALFNFAYLWLAMLPFAILFFRKESVELIDFIKTYRKASL